MKIDRATVVAGQDRAAVWASWAREHRHGPEAAEHQRYAAAAATWARNLYRAWNSK